MDEKKSQKNNKMDEKIRQSSASIQFVKGILEKVVPEVYLTRSRDGGTGKAKFKFINPNILDESTLFNDGEITGMYMIDIEGIIETSNIIAIFKFGQPESLEAIYTMYSLKEWDRFMRFMDRYSLSNGLLFRKTE